MGILAIIAGMGLSFSFDSYRGYLFRAEYTGVTHVIAKARNHSVNNYNESPHGVYFDQANNQYVYFVGDTYNSADPQNEIYPQNPAFTIDGPTGLGNDFTIVFEQLSGGVDDAHSDCDGTPSDECLITFSGGGVRVQTVEINESGGIIWQ